MTAAKKTLFWGVPADVWATAIGVLCTMTLCAPAEADPTSSAQEHIIWNDTQGTDTAGRSETQASTGSGSPIRDSFSSSSSTGSAGGSPPSPGKSSIIWDQSPAKSASQVQSTSPTLAASSMAGPCREFQQQVIIEGRPQRAHGRACRQSDGSWRIVN